MSICYIVTDQTNYIPSICYFNMKGLTDKDLNDAKKYLIKKQI